jgi:membrane-associated phospholipid phosphatase
VKVRTFPGPPVLTATVAQTRSLLRACGQLARRRIGWAIAGIVLAAALALMVYPHDHAWLASIRFLRGSSEKTAHDVAWQVGRWGDYHTYNLPVAILIWVYGVWKKDRAWRRLAVVCFLGATLAGLFDDCFRLTLGRPRPDAVHAVDGFYGPAKALFGTYQSFPSGHAASDIGMAVALLLVCRPLGIITLAYAFIVIWGRLELNKHYPSDVMVGSIVGLYFGILIGSAAGSRRPPDGGASASARVSKNRS